MESNFWHLCAVSALSVDEECKGHSISSQEHGAPMVFLNNVDFCFLCDKLDIGHENCTHEIMELVLVDPLYNLHYVE